MADSGFAPLADAAHDPPPFPPTPDGKYTEAQSGPWGLRPALWVALYIAASLIWLLWGGPLVTAWIGSVLAPPFAHLLTHALFIAASGVFFYWLLYFDARTLQRAARFQDIRLVEFIEQITDAAFIKDRQGRYRVLNSTGANVIGHPLAECLGRDDTELFPAAVARQLVDDDRQVMASGTMHSREQTVALAHGEFLFRTTKWPWRDAAGHIIGIIGISRDSTVLKRTEAQWHRANDELEERVQARMAELTAANQALQDQIAARIQVECALRDSEERFRQLTEHIREVFWVYGITEERLLYVSPAYEEIWGRSAQNLLERPLEWIEAVHPDDRARIHAAHVAKLESGRLDEEYRIVQPDGAVRWIRDRGFPIRDAAGYAYRIAGLAEDITARKLAEDQLRRQQVELAKTSRLSLAVEMASNLAHDINQPLAAIVAYAQACLGLLRQDRIDPRELTGVLEEVAKQGLRAGDIIRHLRDLVHKHPTARTALDLNALIHAVVHYAELELHWGGVTLQLELATPLPVVLANNIQTQLVVLYLMRNAIEAMYETTAEPRSLIVRTALEDPDTVLITLSDSGPGLSPEAAERLFQPFFSTKPGGMGLGLPASRSIIESQGGQLWATPNPDQGMSFHFTLPVYHGYQAPSPHE